MIRTHGIWAAWGLVVVLLASACSSGDGSASEQPATETTATNPGADAEAAPPEAAPESGCADVIEVEIDPEGGGTFDFAVTVRSSDTGNEKYADAWEVRRADGALLGTRALAHPHVDEQPFTRSLSGVEVTADVDEVVIAARDSVSGFCGRTMTVAVPHD